MQGEEGKRKLGLEVWCCDDVRLSLSSFDVLFALGLIFAVFCCSACLFVVGHLVRSLNFGLTLFSLSSVFLILPLLLLQSVLLSNLFQYLSLPLKMKKNSFLFVVILQNLGCFMAMLPIIVFSVSINFCMNDWKKRRTSLIRIFEIPILLPRHPLHLHHRLLPHLNRWLPPAPFRLWRFLLWRRLRYVNDRGSSYEEDGDEEEGWGGKSVMQCCIFENSSSTSSSSESFPGSASCGTGFVNRFGIHSALAFRFHFCSIFSVQTTSSSQLSCVLVLYCSVSLLFLSVIWLKLLDELSDGSIDRWMSSYARLSVPIRFVSSLWFLSLLFLRRRIIVISWRFLMACLTDRLTAVAMRMNAERFFPPIPLFYSHWTNLFIMSFDWSVSPTTLSLLSFQFIYSSAPSVLHMSTTDISFPSSRRFCFLGWWLILFPFSISSSFILAPFLPLGFLSVVSIWFFLDYFHLLLTLLSLDFRTRSHLSFPFLCFALGSVFWLSWFTLDFLHLLLFDSLVSLSVVSIWCFFLLFFSLLSYLYLGPFPGFARKRHSIPCTVSIRTSTLTMLELDCCDDTGEVGTNCENLS